MRREKWLWEYYLVLLLAIAAVGILFKLTRNPDIDFARQVLGDLAVGRESVQDSIDWVTFKTIDNDVGASYQKLANENERTYFRKAFILNFAFSFKNAGGKLKFFSNWRIYAKDKENTIVVADTLSKKTLFFSISQKYGRRKLTSIQFKE